MRILASAALAIATTAISWTSLDGAARAQSQATCGPVTYSVAEQRHVGIPCPH